MRTKTIRVYEQTDPLIQYELTDERGQPFPLGGFDRLEWYVRDTTVGDMPVDPNRSTEAAPGGIMIINAAAGICQVQALRSDIGSVGSKWCFLLGITPDGLTTMLSFRPLKVLGV